MTLSGVLKTIFKFAVLGIGLGIGSELVTEFLFYGALHGSLPISKELASLSLQFTEPIMSWFDGLIGGPEGLSGFKSFLKGVHEFFGIEGTFLPPILPEKVGASKMLLGGGAGPTLLPGLE